MTSVSRENVRAYDIADHDAWCCSRDNKWRFRWSARENACEHCPQRCVLLIASSGFLSLLREFVSKFHCSGRSDCSGCSGRSGCIGSPNCSLDENQELPMMILEGGQLGLLIYNELARLGTFDSQALKLFVVSWR